MRHWHREERSVVEGAEHLPRKNDFFSPQNDTFGCILPQFLTGRKHGSFGTRSHEFYSSIAKLKTLQK